MPEELPEGTLTIPVVDANSLLIQCTGFLAVNKEVFGEIVKG